MKLYQRLMDIRSKKEGKKGFTLVELIVVLVILAILAAILVPALLGYIDRAKESQYELEAKSVYMAAQAEASVAYASAKTGTTGAKLATAFGKTTTVGTRIQSTADVADLDITGITVKGDHDGSTVTNEIHDSYTITGMVFTFTSSKGGKVSATLADGVWTCSKS